MAIIYKLVGYDRKTERQSVKIDIPPKHMAFAKKVVGLAASQEALADYPLDESQARDIAGVIGKAIDTAHYDYFLEPYTQPNHRRSA